MIVSIDYAKNRRPKMYDVIIVGAGPAGATLARLLDTKLKVLLIDKRDLEKTREVGDLEKCCGGLLAPDAQKMLAKLGLGVPKEVLTGPQIFTVKTIDFDWFSERFYQRHYINVDRDEFDRWMVSMIPTNVKVMNSCTMKGFEVTKEGIEINFRKDGHDQVAKGKILVGADGALSQVRRQGFKEIELPNQYISIQEWFETDRIMPYFTSLFDSKISDFYSWTIQKGRYILFGSAIPRNQDANQLHELQKAKLEELGFDFSKRVKRTGTIIFRPKKLKHICIGNEKIALIGEAAGMISPSSAEGISYALSSGMMLAESINKDKEQFFKSYKRKSKKIQVNILWKNIKSVAMYSPWIRFFVMKTGVFSMEVVDKEINHKRWKEF